MNIQKIAIGIFMMLIGFLILFASGVYYLKDIESFSIVALAMLGLLVMFIGMLISFSGLDGLDSEEVK
jgi:hypothetical protein